MFGWLVDLLLTLSVLGRPRHVGSKSPLLVSQVEDGGPQPQLGNLPPYELPVLRVNDTQPHQTVLVHSHQTPSSHLLLQETLGVEMVIVTTVSPQPLLHVNHRPGRVNCKFPLSSLYCRFYYLTIAARTLVSEYWQLSPAVEGWAPSLSFSENIILSLTEKIYFLDQKIYPLRHYCYHWTKHHRSSP